MKSEADDDLLARQLWALGDPVRLRLLRLLPLAGGETEGPNVTQLAEVLGLSQPTVSHHLRVLRQLGLIYCDKRRRDCFYEIEPDIGPKITEALDDLLRSNVDTRA